METILNQIPDTGVVPKHIADEYINKHGYFDAKYLSKKLGQVFTQDEVNELCTARFGFCKFNNTEVRVNEVSLQEFQADYEFGKFVNTREWIQYFHDRHDKYLSKEALFEYVLATV